MRLREGRCWDAEGRERETRAHNTDPVPTPHWPHVPLPCRRRPRLASSTTNFNIFRRPASRLTHTGSTPQDLPSSHRSWLGGGTSSSSLHSFILLLHRPLLHLTSCASQEHSKAKSFRDCSDAPAGSLSRGQAGAGWSRYSLLHTPPEHPDIHYSTSTTPQLFTDSTLPSYSHSNPTRSLPPAPAPVPLPPNSISFILSSTDQLFKPSFSSSLAYSLPHPLPSDSAEHRFGKYP